MEPTNHDLLVVVLCYAGDIDQVERQLDSYTHHGAPVLLLSPEDAPACVAQDGVECRSAGLSGWKGDHVAYKLLEHWRIMLEYPQSWFLSHEPDSLCLSPELPGYLFERTDVLWQSLLGEVGKPGANSAPPWFFHRDVLERLVRVAEANIEEWNRNWSGPSGEGAGLGNSEMVIQAISTDSIPYDAFRDYVWCYQENDPKLLIRRAQDGTPFITGVKTPETYDRIVEAFRAVR